MEDYQIYLIIFGVIVFFIFLFLFPKKKTNQIYPIKKATTCKDGTCFDIFKVQGIEHDFKNYEDAKRYAQMLKENK